VNASQFLQGQLALFAWRDGFNEGLAGMLAVAHVIKRRVEAGWWSGDWAQVLSHHREYSAYIEPYPDTIPDPRVYSIQCLLQEIPNIFSGQTKDDITVPKQSVLARPAAGALYYARLDLISNPWFLDSISRKPNEHPRVAQVGQTFFFA
jgi:hypothetical protein